VPFRLRGINVEIDRPGGFVFNPTNCDPLAVAGAITSTEGVSSPLSVPFQVANCASLAFKPKFSVSTNGKTSKANGASLHVQLVPPHEGPQTMGNGGASSSGSGSSSAGSSAQAEEANIARVKVDLPVQLPTRQSTFKYACLAKVFEANPANCPPHSIIGTATAVTPALPVSLNGPAYFVSHGGEAFPQLEIVLQGYGITVELAGNTFISKTGVTSSTFASVPDVPVSSFELTLPQGPFSVLAANGNLCKPTEVISVKKHVTRRVHGHVKHITTKVQKTIPKPLVMPTEFVAQNGAIIKQSTPIAVTGCPKAKKAKRPRGHTRTNGKKTKGGTHKG